jgi:hypothetical protein
MRLSALAIPFLTVAWFAACAPEHEGGGRRNELPPADNAGGAGGSAGSGVGLSGSSDSGRPDRPDAFVLPECPGPDSGYPVETGIPCAALFEPDRPCRREDDVECVCRFDTLAWDCG